MTFRTSELSDPLWGALAERGAVRTEGGDFRAPVPDADGISVIIDQLRGNGVMIFAVQPTEASLEDAFVELITENNEEAPSA